MIVNNYNEYKKSRKAKVVIYTAISNGFDDLIQHNYISKDFDYICYTDTKIKNPGIWEIRQLKDRNLGSNRNAKYYKLFANKLFPNYEYSIWIDGNINILDNTLEQRIYELIKEKALISANKHFSRNCIYNEALVCLIDLIDEEKKIFNQISYMKKNGFPRNQGLFEMNIIFRVHNNTIIIQAMNDWWSIINKYSKRDQLSCKQMYPVSHRKLKGFNFVKHSKDLNSKVKVKQSFRFVNKLNTIKRILLFFIIMLFTKKRNCK